MKGKNNIAIGNGAGFELTTENNIFCLMTEKGEFRRKMNWLESYIIRRFFIKLLK